MSDYEKLVLELRATLRKVAKLAAQLRRVPVDIVLADGTLRKIDRPVDANGDEVSLPGALVEMDGIFGTTVCADTFSGVEIRWNK